MTQIIIPGGGGGGGLPEGWTTDDSNPATAFTNGGAVIAGGDGDNGIAVVYPSGLNIQRPIDGVTIVSVDTSTDDGLRANVVPPGTDPHIGGAIWNNAGTLTISDG